MASRSRKLEIVIAGDAKGALGAFGEVERGAGGLGDKLQTIGGKLSGFGAKASLAVTLPMVALGKAAFGEAEEAQKIAKQTEAVVRSTGGAANVSVGQVGALADKLSALSGVDDELIQTNANVLLTFTKIRNEVGAGNDIFDQASLAALNMSTALGTDLQGATTMVGKALNDPIAGLTAMTRAGVQFTDQQKDQIAALVGSGDMLGAQKIILGELETQFGGSAAAQATAADKAKVAWGNFQESIGAVLLPFIEKASTFLGDLAGKFGELSPKVQQMVVLGGAVAAALGPVLVVVGNVAKVVGFLASGAGVAVIAIAALVAGAIYAYKNFEGFRNVVDGVVSWLRDNVPGIFATVSDAVVGAFTWIRDNVVPVVQMVVGFVLEKFGALVGWVVTMWPQISEAISHVMNVVQGVIRTVVDVVSALWRAWGDDLLNVARTAFEFIRSTVENVINVVRSIIQTVLAIINGDWGLAWNGIKGVLAAVWDQMRNIVSTVFNIISSAIGGVLSTIAEVWRGAWGGIRDFLSGIWEGMKTTVSNAIGGVVQYFREMPGRIIDGIGNMGSLLVAKGEALINGFARGVRNVAGNVAAAVKDAILAAVRKIPLIGGRAADWLAGALGDGPGLNANYGGPGATAPGGNALRRVQSVLGGFAGARVTSTYRSPAQNRAVGGAPNSYHMDRANPAVDIGGPTSVLDRLAARLRAMGGWRQFLWRVKGHFDHIHVAHKGGYVTPQGIAPLRSDELLAKLQVGETVIPAGAVRGHDGASVHHHLEVNIGTVIGGPSAEREIIAILERAHRKGYTSRLWN